MSDSTHTATTLLPYSLDYPPPDFFDPVVEAYKQDVDLAAIRENLALTVEERLLKATRRSLERATCLQRQRELDDFWQFATRIIEQSNQPQTLEEYLQLWRDNQAQQRTV